MMAEGRSCCGLPDAASRGVPGADEPQGICVCELQEQLGLGQSKTSYHLRVLRDAGLVTEETRGKWSFYALDAAAAVAAFRAFSDVFKLAGRASDGSARRGCLMRAPEERRSGGGREVACRPPPPFSPADVH
jgi:DNA-binding transcriptional ArsR family regulator